MSDLDTLVVRRAGPEDLAVLARLRYTWRTDERGETGDAAEFAERLRSWWGTRTVTHLAWLAYRDDVAVGMAWLGILARVPGPAPVERLAGVVQSVYVDPAHRGEGVGAELLAEVIAYAERAGLGYLTVHPSERSTAVYARAGFVATPKVLELGLREPR